MSPSAKHRRNRFFLWILIIVMGIWMLFPFYWMINSSFKTENQLQMMPATFVPRDPVGNWSPTLRNYEAVFTNDAFLRAILNSAIVAFTVTLLALAIGAFAGFALGKLRYRGKTGTLYVILAMTMFPQIAVLTGLYAIINNLGIQAIPSLILTYLLFSLPFTAWVLTAFFRELPLEDHAVCTSGRRFTVPDVLYDLAAVDGAGTGDDGFARLYRRVERISVCTHLYVGAAHGTNTAGDHRQFPGPVLATDSLRRDHGCRCCVQYSTDHLGLCLPAPDRSGFDSWCGEGLGSSVVPVSIDDRRERPGRLVRAFLVASVSVCHRSRPAPGLLPGNQQNEERQLDHSPPAPGLTQQAIEPFQTQTLHPTWRTPSNARHEVEGTADANGHVDRQFGAVAVDPEVLFGMAKGNQQDLRT